MKKKQPGPPLKSDIDNDKWDDVIEGDDTDEIIQEYTDEEKPI